MSAADLARAKALLQKKVNGNSVYDHLADVLLKVIAENPDDAVGVFEALSASAKQQRFNVSASTAAGKGVAESKADPDRAAAQAAWAASTEALFKAPEPAEGVDEPAPVQDLADEANYLSWAGVDLGREEAFRLSLALKHLAASVPVTGLRFWGKILGTGGDYIVAEGVTDGGDGEEARDSNGVLLENGGEGANKFTYFVCSYAGGAWTKLPNVTPEQVVVARSIRRFFTGDLDASVGGHPPFPGTERNYLRAQIARISAATVLSPSGYFVAGEDEEQFNIAVNEEEYEVPALNELGSWVHSNLEVNVLGRCLPQPPTTNEDGEEVEDPDAPEPSPVLRAIEEEEGDWNLRQLPAAGRAEGAEGGLVVVRSLRWPGASTVGFGKRFANVYVGFGQRYAQASYAPPAPAAVQGEFDVTALAEDATFGEGVDVTEDPDAGVPAGDGEGEDDE